MVYKVGINYNEGGAMRKEIISGEVLLEWILEQEELAQLFLGRFDLKDEEDISLDMTEVKSFTIKGE